MPSDDELIAAFIAKRGVVKLPDQAAAEMGESSPGWRRKVEYRAEKTTSKKAKRRQQRKLRSRYAPELPAIDRMLLKTIRHHGF